MGTHEPQGESFNMRSFVLSAAVLAGLTSVAAAEPYTHDGFYLGLTGGLGYMHISAPGDTSISGFEIPNFGINIGKSITSKLVLGGGAFVDYSSSAKYMDTDIPGSEMVIALGAFADYYLDPHRGGLHFQGFLGWGGLEETEGTGGSDPTGLTIFVGAGWEKFITAEMSVGAVGRLTYGSWSLSGGDFTLISPTALATLTWH
jgi:hypothetical protein